MVRTAGYTRGDQFTTSDGKCMIYPWISHSKEKCSNSYSKLDFTWFLQIKTDSILEPMQFTDCQKQWPRDVL